MGVARENRQKGFPVHSRKLLPVWCRKRFSRLGSEICTSCSSTPEAEARCATSGISEPPRSAYTSRSEEHTSELQSRLHLVCRLLLEKKKKQLHIQQFHTSQLCM